MSNSVFPATQVINFPAGMIMPYAGASVPAGWLECNGAEIDIVLYPTLAAALDSTWNTAKNPLTGANYSAPASGKFRVPDMRGAFLRGSSGGVNNAQGVPTALAEFQAHKTAKNGIAAAASGVSGSATSGGVDHTHPFGRPGNVAASWDGWIVNDSAANRVHAFRISVGDNTGGSSAWAHTHGLSATAAAQAITGDNETRPDSVGVRYLIKA